MGMIALSQKQEETQGTFSPSARHIVLEWSACGALIVMAETQEQWYQRQAVEHLAQHIPFEQDVASKAEQIEMLRSLVIRHGREMDPALFGFEARCELMRLGLWERIGPGPQAASEESS
jgi:hypothetical protein